jgi:hypothetical protein
MSNALITPLKIQGMLNELNDLPLCNRCKADNSGSIGGGFCASLPPGSSFSVLSTTHRMARLVSCAIVLEPPFLLLVDECIITSENESPAFPSVLGLTMKDAPSFFPRLESILAIPGFVRRYADPTLKAKVASTATSCLDTRQRREAINNTTT